MTSAPAKILVGTLAQLREQDCFVVAGHDRPIAVFFNEGDLCAVDNRCPHMGFALSQGGCKDGMMLCPWHHARFEAHSGCTFDLFAGDVDPFDVWQEGEDVYVSALPRQRDAAAHARRRLREGTETNNSLVIAKAILSLLSLGEQHGAILREAALYGAAHRDGWSGGLTSLAALGNLLPLLKDETAYLALFQGVRRVAADCAGQTSRRQRYALETEAVGTEKLGAWLNNWALVRHRDAAERTLLTAVANEAGPVELKGLLIGAALQRVYADTGHPVDFGNKCFELLDIIGWENAVALFPTQVGALTGSRGAEEQNSWRQPQDLLPLMSGLVTDLGPVVASATGAWSADDAVAFAEGLLHWEPEAIVHHFLLAAQNGASAPQLAQAVTYAASLRVLRFGKANELGDWFTALHTFSYSHAMHAVVRGCAAPELLAGVVHGAFSIYQDRFLNVPPARLPAPVSDWPSDGPALLQQYLEALNGRSQDLEAAALVAQYLELGHPVASLFDTLTYAVVREDADFHTIQMLEAAIAEYQLWGPSIPGDRILTAAARYIAAFAPTQRAQNQTAQIAWRLHRGEKVFEE